MSIKFKTTGGLLVLLAIMSFPAVAAAQTETPNYETPSEVFERAFFKNAPNFYGSQTFKSQINDIFGPGSIFRNSFPENQIARDAELVNTVYRDVLNQQVGNDPYIRTPDLPNPYGASLLMSPRMNADKLKVGTEFRFETALPR
ncbi:hypothetical protein [Mastigocladopsis repens]|uniref:hypothetical protein n=1 Tax=Mastigocladopsis repens TaxID=221287 RepID=UPI0002E7FDE7|nr:hypothetical protein [Mastigocladopsis repens]